MLKLLWGLILKLIGLIAPPHGPSAEAQASARAAVAETRLQTEESANAEVQQAVAAARAVGGADAADASRLRRRGDPDCRDCA